MKLVDAQFKENKKKKDAVFTRPEVDARMADAISRMKSAIRMPKLEQDIKENNDRIEEENKKKKQKKD